MALRRGTKKDRRLLSGLVVEADMKNFGSMDYCVRAGLYQVGSDKEVKSEVFDSPVVKSSSHPVFSWRFALGEKYNLNNTAAMPSLRVYVLSKKGGMAGFNAKKTALAYTELDLEDLGERVEKEGSVEEWFELTPTGTAAGTGRVKLSLNFSSAAADDRPGAGETVLTVDEDDEEDVNALKEKFKEVADKKGKLGKSKVVDLMTTLTQGGIKQDVLKKRYEKFTGGAKSIQFDEFHDFYNKLRPKEPNELQVVAVRAEQLRAMDRSMLGGSGKSDPYVVFKIGKSKQKTRIIRKDLNPFWNQKFSFKANSPQAALEVLVYDHDDVGTDDFMGRTTIPLKSLIGKPGVSKRHELKDSKGNKEAQTRGYIELICKWRYNSDPSFGGVFGDGDDSDDDSSEEEEDGDDDEADDGADPDVKDEEAKKIKAETKDDDGEEKVDPKAKQKDQQKDFKIKTGDYQIHVHIIEARDLKAKDLNGMSDPVVTVECFGKKQNTAVISSTLNPVWDDLLIFNLKGLEREEFEEGIIKVSVKDSDLLTSNDVIGMYALDATYVYYQTDHELYKSWVGLINEVDVEDSGCQGYLKLSIQIVGPDDKLKIHLDGEDENKGSGDMNDISSMVLMPPTIKRQQKWLVVTAHCAEHLPILDAAIGAGGIDLATGGIDAYYKVQYSESKVSSKVVTIKGKSRHMMNPEFHYDLWIPVTTPSMTNQIKHSVWDYDSNPLDQDDIAGMFTSKFKEVEKKGKLPPRWVNLYGAPTINKSKTATLATGLHTLGHFTDWRKKYNENPDLGSTFRGRVLISEKIRSTLPKKEIAKDRPFMPWKKKRKPLAHNKYPSQETYVLRATIVAGSELPQLKSNDPLDRGRNRKLGVMICCGKYQILSDRAPNENGCCHWAIDQDVEMELPDYDAAPDSFPDVIVYLYQGKTGGDMIPICFSRIKAEELFTAGFSGDFKWYPLKEDKALDRLKENTYPGSVLLRLGLGTLEDSNAIAQSWAERSDKKVLNQRVPYIVRLHLFQCRDLPAADDNGLIDPYLKINVNGKVLKSTKKKDTRDPMYYECFDFATEIVHNQGFQLAPRVNIQVWDYDWGLTPMASNDDYCGVCMVDLKDAFVDASTAMDGYTSEGSVMGALPHDLPKSIKVLNQGGSSPLEAKEFPDPKWNSFFFEEPGDGEGQVLVSVQLIPSKPGHAARPDIPDIKPETMEAYLELTTLGCRNLIPYNYLPITLPRLEFVLETPEEKITSSSPESKKPSPQNPNFLRYDVIKVPKFPRKSIFAPRLVIKAYDTRLGGLSKPNIGNASVPLEQKLPWDLENYVATVTSFTAPPPEPEVPEGEEGEEEVKEGEEEEQALLDGEEVKEEEEEPSSTVALFEPQGNYKERVHELAGDEDTGAGVFGAFKHLEKEREKEDEILADSFAIKEEEEEDDDGGPPPYMIDRQRLTETLEEAVASRPFESFGLLYGQGKSLRQVGLFKGLVRVFDHEPAKDEAPFDMSLLLKPASYKVRLYVLRGIAFTPMDPGWGGRPGKSDPYLHCILGKESFNDRENFVEDATDVDFFKCVELDAELPGAGQLVINVKDYDTFGTDDLIGRTIIDLEDRWFDGTWQELGSHTLNKDPEKMRWKAKPLEIRPIFQPPETTKSQPQGHLETWVDILQPAEATAFPVDDVTLPPAAIFEVRFVVWKAKNVVSMDSLTHMNDTYVKAHIEGVNAQTTDIHWRAKKGKASWNWRMKFDVSLGHNTRSMKFPYLNIQMWDKDILKYDDLIAETMIDLGKPFKKAYRKNKSVKLFTNVKKGWFKKKGKPTQEEITYDDNEEKEDTTDEAKEYEFEELGEPDEETGELRKPSADVVQPDATKGDNDLEDRLFGGDDLPARASKGNDDPVNPLHGNEASSGNGIEMQTKKQDTTPTLATTPTTGAAKRSSKIQSAPAPTTAEKKKSKKEEAKKSTSRCPSIFGSKKKEVDSDDEEEPLLDEKEQEKKDDDAQVLQLVSTAKGMLGLGEDDPPESDWLHMTKTDHEAEERIPMGKLCVSLQVIPKLEAKMNDNGFGRREPNHSPLLPPPVGRLKWSWNPFVLGSQLCGPKLCFYFTCCCVCIIVVVVMIFCQPLANLIIALCVKLLI